MLLRRRDPATLRAALAAANFMYRVLRSRLCTCTYNIPYEGCPLPRFVIARCARCIALAGWEAIEQEEETDHEPDPSVDAADRALAEP